MRAYPMRRKRSFSMLHLLLATIGAALVTSVPLAATTGSATAAGPGHTWADYFYPLKVGWTCHESFDTNGVKGTETLSVASVGTVRGGRSITVDEASATTVKGTTVPTNAALHYMLTNAGGLVAVPSSTQIAGQAYREEGNTVYPSVRALLSGGSSTSGLHISTALNASQRSEIGGVLPSGATSLDMAVAIRQSGTDVPTLRTPDGTYHNALVVHSSLKSIHVTNALKSASKDLDSTLKPIVAKELASTTWYAVDHGPVKFKLDGITAYITNCGLSSSPTGSTGNSGDSPTGTSGNTGATRT